MSAFKFNMKRINDTVSVYIIFLDGTYSQIAVYTVPHDNNWRADVTFFDSLLDIYKQRYKHLQY